MNELKIQPLDLENPFSSLEKDRETIEKYCSDPQQEEKNRLYKLFTSDIVWTINKDGKVSYVNPFVENCIGMDADKVIKDLASKYLSQVSILSCLIELEELKSHINAEYKMKPRKLFIETLMFEGIIRKLEITTYASYDSMNNFVGFTGACQEVK